MFGMGASEILVILVVALLFLGPEKLPEAASKISKGIRDIRKQTRELQTTIENDSQLGGAIRDLKSALRGEEPRPRRPEVPAGPPDGELPAAVPPPPLEGEVAAAGGAAVAGEPATRWDEHGEPIPDRLPGHDTSEDDVYGPDVPRPGRVPPSAGERDGGGEDDGGDDGLPRIRPAAGIVAKGAAPDAGEPGDDGEPGVPAGAAAAGAQDRAG